MVEDRLADREVETPRLERQRLAAGDVELDPVGDAVELGTLPRDLDARLRQVERRDERAAPGQDDRQLAETAAVLEDPAILQVAQELGHPGHREVIRGVAVERRVRRKDVLGAQLARGTGVMGVRVPLRALDLVTGPLVHGRLQMRYQRFGRNGGYNTRPSPDAHEEPWQPSPTKDNRLPQATLRGASRARRLPISGRPIRADASSC